MNIPSRPADFDEFDPYYRWLGIQKAFRPPTYYQLLGVAITESDFRVIEAASKRHLHYVRQFRGTEHDAIANRLIYEIELAAVTLLSGQLRGEYDLTLKSSKIPHRVWERRNRTPTYRPSGSVGEGSEIVSSFMGIMGIIVIGILIMAGASFYLPWQKLVFSGRSQDAVESTGTVSGTGPFGRKSAGTAADHQTSLQNGPGGPVLDPAQDSEPAENAATADAAISDTAEDVLATIEAVIVKVDSGSRVISIQHGSKVADFDVSRSAAITIDGKASSLESLKTGQFVSVEFNPEFDVAVKIDTRPAPPAIAEATTEARTPESSDAAIEPASGVVSAAESSTSESDVSVDATVTAINLEQRSLTALSNSNSKSITLELTGKTKVTLNGSAATLESIAIGQTGTVTFDPEFDVITKFEITGTAAPETTPDAPAAPEPPSGPESDPKIPDTGDESNLVSAEVTIESFDAEQRTMKVLRDAKPGSFDVSRKATIKINDIETSLEKLPVGSLATITFDPELEVITEIQIKTSSDEKNESQ